jgi:hypothetical protein
VSHSAGDEYRKTHDRERKTGMDLLDKLKKNQKEAVIHTEGPLLILPGAGSGRPESSPTGSPG